MKNILSTVENKHYQLIASYNGLTEDLLDKKIVLNYRTLFPTKSNKFIAIEMTKAQLQSIISLYQKNNRTIVELYSNASCVVDNNSIQILSTAETGSVYSIELNYTSSILNFFDNINLQLENKDVEEERYTCRHRYLGETSLIEDEDKYVCTICKSLLNLDVDRDKLKDAKEYLIQTLQGIKAINVELTDEDIKQIAKTIFAINNIDNLLDEALKVLNKY